MIASGGDGTAYAEVLLGEVVGVVAHIKVVEADGAVGGVVGVVIGEGAEMGVSLVKNCTLSPT